MKKTYSEDGNKCWVTFELPAEANINTAYLCGEFNDWDKTQNQVFPRKDGNFSTTIVLETGRAYRYRYWVDGERWENDWSADKYLKNNFGTEDSVVIV